ACARFRRRRSGESRCLMFERPRSGERAVLVRLGLGAPLDPEDLSEFTQLATSAGAIPVATITGRRERPDPRYFVGSGKADEIRLEALAQNADVILIDHPLSPSQECNLEKLTGKRVRVLTERLEKIKLQRETGRGARVAIPNPSIALVGYTNAGKSTLFRSLTGENAYVADQLFATLDPTVRRLQLPGGTTVVAADTVGFIRDLPHDLVAAFESTLTEAREANLLLHVIDASDPRRAEHIEEVDRVLTQIGAGEIPSIRVFNKIDRLEVEPHVDRGENGEIEAI